MFSACRDENKTTGVIGLMADSFLQRKANATSVSAAEVSITYPLGTGIQQAT
jgi:hypothetical protein